MMNCNYSVGALNTVLAFMMWSMFNGLSIMMFNYNVEIIVSANKLSPLIG